MHVNNQYVRNGDLELEKLFALDDITDYVVTINERCSDQIAGAVFNPK